MDRSVDSIGSCSLDVDADSTDFSDTSGELNFLTPISGKDITREFTAGIKERCMLPVINCQAVTSVLDPVTGHISTVLTTTASSNAQQQQQPLLGGGGDSSPTTVAANKKPSYLNLACCVNGYSNLTTYDSKLRQDINKSREVSPSRPIIATLHYNRTDSAGGGGHLLTAPTLSYVSMNNTINNNNYNGSSTTIAASRGGGGMLKMNGTGGRMRAMNGTGDVTDNGGGLFNGNGSFAGAGMRTKVISSQSQISSHMRGDDTAQLMTPKKSFIQQRVEKLYGASDVVVLNKQNYSSSERRYLNNIANDNNGGGGGTPVKLVQHNGGSVTTTGPIGNGTARNGGGVANGGGGVLYAANGGGATNGSSFVHVDENNRQINGGGGGDRSHEGADGEEPDVDSLPVLRHLRPEFRAQLQIFSPKKMPKQSPNRTMAAGAAAAANGNTHHTNGNSYTDHLVEDHRTNGTETNRTMVSTTKSTRSSSHTVAAATNGTTISTFSSSSSNGHHHTQQHEDDALKKSSNRHHGNATSTRSVETSYQTVRHQEQYHEQVESHSVSSSTAVTEMVTTVEEKMRSLVVVSSPSNAGGDGVGRMSTTDGSNATATTTVIPVVAVPDGEPNPVTVAPTSVIENGVRRKSSSSSSNSSNTISSSTGREQISTLSVLEAAPTAAAERSASSETVTCDNIPPAEEATPADNMRTARNGSDTVVVVDGSASVHSFAQQQSRDVDEIDRAAVMPPPASLIEVTTNGSSSNNNTVLDGNYFLQILKTEQNRLGAMADEVEKEINQMKADGVELGEDMNGYILVAVGKARLLCSQKMKQFEDLCYTNLNQSPDEKFQTTGEDLRGFWDMVMLQVNNVDASFAEIDSFRKNGWRKPIPKSPQPARNGSATRTKLVKRPYKTGGGSTVTDGSNGGVEAKKASAALAAAKREAQRKQLMEMKRKQKLAAAAAAAASQQTAVEIFAPSTAADGSMVTNGDDKASCTPSPVGVNPSSAALVDTS